MSVISEKLNKINNAKNDIKTSIENKGVSVGDISIEEYASKIDEIVGEEITKPEQEKYVNPTTEKQTVLPDEGYTLSKVEIEAIPTETKTVSNVDFSNNSMIVTATNGKYMTSVEISKPTTLIAENVKKDVNIAGIVGTLETGGGGSADFEINDCSYLFYNGARLDVKDELYKLIDENCENFKYMFWGSTSEIDNFNFNTKNGKNFDYMFSNMKMTKFPLIDTSNGISFSNMYNTNVATEFPLINTSNGTNFESMYQSCSKATEFPLIDTSNGTNFESMYYYCNSMVTSPAINTSNGTNFKYMFASCTGLKTLPEYDFSKAINLQYLFQNIYGIVNINGFKDLGKGYTSKYNNTTAYTLDLSKCSNLTHDSLMNIINKVYDLNLTYNVANGGTLYTQKLVFGATNIAKLTSDELSIATNKGWVVS